MDAILWLNEYARDNNEFTTSNKSDEEIKKLTLEEDLGEVKRSIHIITKGQQIQKYAIYSNLKRIFSESEAFDKFASILQSDIMNQTEEIQIEASRSIIKMVNSKEFPQEKLIVFYRITLQVLKLWSQNVLDNWVLTFNELLCKIPYESIEKETVSTINALSASSQHILSKYIAGRMIGFVATRIQTRFGGQLLDKALSLCQDIDVEVRRVMTQEVLLKVTLAMGDDYAEYKMLNRIIELVYDSNLQVKLASIDILIEMTDLLSDECKKTRVTGTLLDFCTTNNEDIIRKISSQIGKICHKLQTFIVNDPSHLSTIQSFYKDAAYHKSLEIRKNFVHNLPAMLQILENKDQLRHLFAKMLKDPSKELKMKAVACFSEVCKILATVDLVKNLTDPFENLLLDEDNDVITKLVPQLPDLVEIFEEAKNSESDTPTLKDSKESSKEKQKDPKDTQSQHLEKSYLDMVLNIGNALSKRHLWRLEVQLIDGFQYYYEIFDAKELNDKVVPFLIKRIKEGINEVRLKAIEMLTKFMRINYLTTKFKDLMKLFQDEFYQSSCYQMRIAYFHLFLKFGEIFSRTFVKQHFLNSIFALAGDKVSQVRRRLASNLAEIRTTLLHDDPESIKKFAEFVNRLSQDTDKEKASSFKKVLEVPLADCEEDEKERLDEEEELRTREYREIEESKKKLGDDQRLDYLQNYLGSVGGTNSRLASKSIKVSQGKITVQSKLHRVSAGSVFVAPTIIKSKTGPMNGSLLKQFGKSPTEDSSPLSANTKTSSRKSVMGIEFDSKAHKKANFAPSDKIPETKDKPIKKGDDSSKTEIKTSKQKETSKEPTTPTQVVSNRTSSDASRKNVVKIK